jgi:hypothetical protein
LPSIAKRFYCEYFCHNCDVQACGSLSESRFLEVIIERYKTHFRETREVLEMTDSSYHGMASILVATPSGLPVVFGELCGAHARYLGM